MIKSSLHIRRHLRASTPVAALLDEIERRERTLSAVRRQLPAELAGHCRQAAVVGDELTLFVDSPVWVDRFRFLGSELVDALVASGFQVARYRVRVLPAAPAATSAGPAARNGPQRAGLAARTDASASKLDEALARLARTLGRD
jgi:hypothetical protein